MIFLSSFSEEHGNMHDAIILQTVFDAAVR